MSAVVKMTFAAEMAHSFVYEQAAILENSARASAVVAAHFEERQTAVAACFEGRQIAVVVKTEQPQTANFAKADPAHPVQNSVSTFAAEQTAAVADSSLRRTCQCVEEAELTESFRMIQMKCCYPSTDPSEQPVE